MVVLGSLSRAPRDPRCVRRRAAARGRVRASRRRRAMPIPERLRRKTAARRSPCSRRAGRSGASVSRMRGATGSRCSICPTTGCRSCSAIRRTWCRGRSLTAGPTSLSPTREYPPGAEGDRARHDAFLELYGSSPASGCWPSACSTRHVTSATRKSIEPDRGARDDPAAVVAQPRAVREGRARHARAAAGLRTAPAGGRQAAAVADPGSSRDLPAQAHDRVTRTPEPRDAAGARRGQPRAGFSRPPPLAAGARNRRYRASSRTAPRWHPRHRPVAAHRWGCLLRHRSRRRAGRGRAGSDLARDGGGGGGARMERSRRGGRVLPEARARGHAPLRGGRALPPRPGVPRRAHGPQGGDRSRRRLVRAADVARSIARRPTLTVYALTSGGEEIALVRWPTTIGGWKKETGPRGSSRSPLQELRRGRARVARPRRLPAWLPPPDAGAGAECGARGGPRKWPTRISWVPGTRRHTGS